ncbi:MAG: rhomboid family intramembrane serine protease [Ruminococcus sp.]|nr:rhomboid family intramembrane serine protease [Ruminococcus sp.]
MVFAQLENLMLEYGFQKVPSNLPEFTFFFRLESTYVNVLHVIEYKQGLYITEDQYEHIKGKINDFFREKGMSEIHILSLLISPDTEKSRVLCGNDAFCWLIDPVENRLLIHENQVADFYGMKKILEDFLYDISAGAYAQQETGERESAARKGYLDKEESTAAGAWVNIGLILLNVILFVICTFTDDLLYNIGAFSIYNIIEDHEWYRIFSSMFLHADIGHLVSNMLVLYYIGNVIEKHVGHLSYMVLYFLSGFVGSIFYAGYELLTGNYMCSVGASGAVFGVEGALLMLALLHKGELADVTVGRIVFTIFFALYCGFTSSYVNNAAHVGGVLSGFLMAGIFWLLSPKLKKKQD